LKNEPLIFMVFSDFNDYKDQRNPCSKIPAILKS